MMPTAGGALREGPASTGHPSPVLPPDTFPPTRTAAALAAKHWEQAAAAAVRRCLRHLPVHGEVHGVGWDCE